MESDMLIDGDKQPCIKQKVEQISTQFSKFNPKKSNKKIYFIFKCEPPLYALK